MVHCTIFHMETFFSIRDLDSRFLKIGTGSLQITKVQEQDRGQYQCRADNREDSVDSTATVEVQG